MDGTMILRYTRLCALSAFFLASGAHVAEAQTTFTFGGYAKLDVMSTRYFDGDVDSESPLRDFHLPAAIPIGGSETTFIDLDFHVKESRFNLGTATKVGDDEVKTFVEFDFMLSPAGDERVSNSYNPRLRHFYFTYKNWLFGQTWMTFQIVVLPEDLDFPGAANGIIFGRQPMIRYTNGPWQFAIANPETVVTGFQTGSRIVTESGRIPDVVGRYNFSGDWGTFSLAGILRGLSYNDPASDIEDWRLGYGATAGGMFNVGERDNFYAVANAGSGLGRYAAFNFANSSVLDQDDKLQMINSVGGWVGYRHWWDERWRTSVNVDAILVDNDSTLTGPGVNKSGQSLSANILYSPDKPLTFGIEGMWARREIENGTDGSFFRIQFSARYAFNFATTAGKK
jgi:hypothetical protein